MPIVRHKNRLEVTTGIAGLVWVIGMIVIFVSLTLIFFKNWNVTSSRVGCPKCQAVNFLSKIQIIQIIYIVMIGVFSASMFFISLTALIHNSNIQQLWHRSAGLRTVYPFLIAVALVTGIVSILYIIKTLAHIVEINNLYNQGQIPSSCLTATQVGELTNKITPLIIVLALIGLMILLTIVTFYTLPYTYFLAHEEEKYQIRIKQPLKQQIVIVEKKQQKIMSPIRLQQLQISHQQLLDVQVRPAKSYSSTGVGQFTAIQPVILPVKQPQVKTKPSIKTAQVAVNSQRTPMKNQGVDNHVEVKNAQTDCHGLQQPKIYKNQSVEVQIQNYVNVQSISQKATQQVQQQTEKMPMSESKLRRLQRTETKRVDPQLLTPRNKRPQVIKISEDDKSVQQEDFEAGYYYLKSDRENSVHDSKVKSSKKLQNHSSGKKMIESNLRASRGAGIDWSHYNLLWVDQRLNNIYTPKTGKEQEAGLMRVSSTRKVPTSQKWWKNNRQK